jgi:GTP cyclohydrolase I
MHEEMIEAAVRQILEAIGEDHGRPGLSDTPRLVAEAAGKILSGYGRDPREAVEVIEGPDEIVLVRDVPFFSVCEHHLLPFFGTADVAILPDGGRIAGFGSLADLVDVAARRLQIQERLTAEIADALEAALRPRGVYVALRARQLCMQMPEGKNLGSETRTLAVRGAFREEPARSELQALLAGGSR